MTRAFTRREIVALTASLGLISPRIARGQADSMPAGMELVMDGLTNPRGFTWGTDGTLFLAQAGTGGPNPGPEGSPFSGGLTASVVAIADGQMTIVAEGMPSSIWTDIGWVWGAMDVAILGEQLYVLNGGGNAVHGNPDTPSGVYQVNADGSTVLIVDLGTWVDENPVADEPPEGTPNGGSFFAMVAADDALWVCESVNGQILRVAPDTGEVERVADLSAGHPVPSGIAPAPGGPGGVYVGFLTAAPYPNEGTKISRVSAEGSAITLWSGLTTVTAVALGPASVLYAAEMATDNLDTEPFIQPGTGRIVRQSGASDVEVVIAGLDYPVAMRFGPDGLLYVALPAFGADDGSGMLVRLDTSVELPIGATPEAGGATPVASPEA
jgi:sugar lactone lactonase YvrE